ncbi:MAG: o-succinylbenzoate synthase [Actinomycetota bacterium]
MSRVLAVELRLVHLELVRPFTTSFGTETMKEAILVKVETDVGEGWGESVTGADPAFSEEFNDDVWVVTREFLAPTLFESGDVVPEGVAAALGGYRGHRMAKSALEMAILDAQLRTEGRSMASAFGGERDRVPVGVSVGITPTVEEMVEQVAGYLAEGYQRIKLKIKPGFDLEPVGAVRAAFPDIMLSVDANAAYDRDDLEIFRSLDAFGLLMIEQPFHHEDLVDHAWLQERIETSLCLDESIRSESDARAALELGSCRIVNIKPGRVGGYLEAKRIHDLCLDADVPVWCGGMLETGLGRAGNLALASLPGFTLPGDISASRRYFHEDLTEPFEVEADGTMAVPQGPGLGVYPDEGRLEARTSRVERIEPG